MVGAENPIDDLYSLIDGLEERIGTIEAALEHFQERLEEVEHKLAGLKKELDRRLEPIEEYSVKLLEQRVSGDDSTRRFLKEKAKQKVEEKARKRIDWQKFFRKLRKSKKGDWAPAEELEDTGILEELRKRNGCITTKRLKIYLLKGSKGEYVRVLRREQ